VVAHRRTRAGDASEIPKPRGVSLGMPVVRA